MMEKAWEYSGRTAEEATQTALEELGLERDDIQVEILEEPQKGFLGLGGKEARIRVELIGEWEVMGKKDSMEEEEREIQKDEDELALQETIPVSNEAESVRMVEDVLGIMGVEAMVEAKEREEAVVIDIWGEDIAILIGSGGRTLDAFQYLVNVCCRKTEGITKRITVDIEGYRRRKEERIEKQARQMADNAISRGEKIKLSPMNPSERKIVHMALRSVDGVWTESDGEGPERRVVIHPENESST